MSPPETHSTIFATTRWTLVCEAARGGDTDAAEALGALFQTYWPPLYRYVRRLGRTEPDAEDLVQGFFAHLLQLDGLRLADRDRGRFRAFLLGSLKHYMANDWEREHRLKRGETTQMTTVAPVVRGAFAFERTEGGSRWYGDVVLEAEAVRTFSIAKKTWTPWRKLAPEKQLTYTVMNSNGVWVVENAYGDFFTLPRSGGTR